MAAESREKLRNVLLCAREVSDRDDSKYGVK